MYLFRAAEGNENLGNDAPRVQLLGSGTILREVLAAADLLASDFEVAADVWSVPSFTELRREGLDVDAGITHPTEKPNAAMWKRRWPTDRDRSSRQRITSGQLPTRSGRLSIDGMRCSAPMDSADPTIGRHCAASLKLIVTL